MAACAVLAFYKYYSQKRFNYEAKRELIKQKTNSSNDISIDGKLIISTSTKAHIFERKYTRKLTSMAKKR